MNGTGKEDLFALKGEDLEEVIDFFKENPKKICQ